MATDPALDSSSSPASGGPSGSDVKYAWQRVGQLVVLGVVALQVVVPVLVGVPWRDTLRPDDAWAPGSATVELTECPDLLFWDLADPQMLANLAVGRRPYRFYDRVGHRCVRRTDVEPTSYSLAKECPANLRIRDKRSCDRAADWLADRLRNATVACRLEGGGCQFDHSWGQWGFVAELCACLPMLPPALLVMCSAAAVGALAAWLASRERGRLSGAVGRHRIRRGAEQLACRAKLAARTALAFRLVQSAYTLAWLQCLMLKYRPAFVFAVMAGFLVPCALANQGGAALSRPVLLLVPTHGSGPRGTATGLCFGAHAILAAVLPVGIMSVVAAWREHDFPFPFLNGLAVANILMQSWGEVFVTALILLAMCAAAVHLPWALGRVCCDYCRCGPRPAGAAEVRELAARVQEAAAAGFRPAEGAPRDPAGAWDALEAEGVVREQLRSHPPMMPWAPRVWPGSITIKVGQLLLDMATDTVAWTSLLGAGHVKFAGCLAASSFFSTFVQLRRGLWADLPGIIAEVARRGVPTDEYLELFDSERGVEALVALTVQWYAYNYGGIDSLFGFLNAVVSILSSLYGFSSYLVDTVDLHIGEGEDEVQERPPQPAAGQPLLEVELQ